MPPAATSTAAGAAKDSGPASASSTTADSKDSRPPKFPTHNTPRVWFLTAASSPIGVALARHLLSHGDFVIAGVAPGHFSNTGDVPSDTAYDEDFATLLSEIAADATRRTHLRVVALNPRSMAQCQSAMAEALVAFERVDILVCCSSFCAVGSVEELAATEASRMAVRDLFEVNFFSAVNIIKAALPSFRAARNGHIIVLTGISGHLGTPGLGLYCASQWAIEGYCDSLAYEVAPFNIRTTIVQPHVEIGVLTNRIVSAPPMACYGAEANGAPLFRDLLSGLLDKLEGRDTEESLAENSEDGRGPSTGDLLHQDRVANVWAPLGKILKERLVAETVHAVAAIGGHDNPPSRHIVGHEGVASVKEKLKTVSEELEDFVEISAAVDIGKDDAPVTVLTAP
ncbi:short chain dehydrogenase/reductase family protein-like protein [Myriangium duriaei CBS 260.36]|uniref:Short chain dehydrogenase/reductase family protein-like protein n=1 Tax=Myriangium duriaei CBS 260.36 TaxID=1168546 RepID=A0A9P4J8V9_9PEZI|nr:short chain dehydrogenase/reductase family protein-like protein [Myriangium duriaei CBS 260.36]